MLHPLYLHEICVPITQWMMTEWAAKPVSTCSKQKNFCLCQELNPGHPAHSQLLF